MKNTFAPLKIKLFLSFYAIASLLAGCQSDPEQDRQTVRDQWMGQKDTPIINHGKVIVKLEPHGSVRAKVFQGQVPAYEFILDRERAQDLLTGDISQADVYLTGEHQDGLVIDDLQTKKRYVLSLYDITDRLRTIPPVQHETFFIKGYSLGLIPLGAPVALNDH